MQEKDSAVGLPKQNRKAPRKYVPTSHRKSQSLPLSLTKAGFQKLSMLQSFCQHILIVLVTIFLMTCPSICIMYFKHIYSISLSYPFPSFPPSSLQILSHISLCPFLTHYTMDLGESRALVFLNLVYLI